MPVVSISLTEKNLKTLDMLQRAYGLTGRSEAVRTCIRSAEAEVRERDALQGDIEGVLITIHQSDDTNGNRHEYQEIITTQVHSHLKNGKCLDVFLIRGPAKVFKMMLTELQGSEHMEYVNFIQS
ncbi:MAG: hypothetical protein GX307_01640 [Euryarchaeota archaeon]|nr:hypothetical protein [Euryarchaeota archaeon]